MLSSTRFTRFTFVWNTATQPTSARCAAEAYGCELSPTLGAPTLEARQQAAEVITVVLAGAD